MKKIFLSALFICVYLTHLTQAEFEKEEILSAFNRACPPFPVLSPRSLESGEKAYISFEFNEARSSGFGGSKAAHYLENTDLLDEDEMPSKVEDLTGYYMIISFKCHAPREFAGKEIGYLNIAVVENQKTGIRLSYLDEVQLESESPLFSGIGLGTTALDLFSKISDKLKCKWSSLRVVTDSSRAGWLYEKFGFRVTERSIRRLERFGITPEAFVKDTSRSREFAPPICMYRLMETEKLDPLNHIDLDLLCVRREPGKPLLITPEKRKAIEEFPLRGKENLMPKAEEESMDSLFGGLGMDSASSSPKRSSPLKHEDSASTPQRPAPSMRRSLTMDFSSSDEGKKAEIEMMDSFDLSLGVLEESTQAYLTPKDSSLKGMVSTVPYTSTPFGSSKRRCLFEKILSPDEGKDESFMSQDQDGRGSDLGIRSLPTSPQRHSPEAIPHAI